ncbi:unnamed protein product [Camellia sinensis]
MDIQCLPSSLYANRHRDPEISSSWTITHQQSITLSFKSTISYSACAYCYLQRKIPSNSWKLSVSTTKTKKCLAKFRDKSTNLSDKKGTIPGAVALIIGTTIGSGILALPQKTSPAGLLPSSITMITCWAFLLIEASLLVEINVELMRKKEKRVDENELEVLSIRTMAQETLGDWGGTLATMTYVFLGYTAMVAYSSKSGEILHHLINLPESVSGFFFTLLFTALISIGGTRATDRINQLLTVSMIGLLLAIEVLAIMFGGWSGLEGDGDWGKVPATVLVCAYLGGDLQRIRASVMLGSVVPSLALLVWDAVALGLSAHADQVSDPVELLLRNINGATSSVMVPLYDVVKWTGVSFMVEAFSLLAVGTSLIGTLLGFFEFFKEQLNNSSWRSPSTQILQKTNKLFSLRKWWGRNKVSFTATAMAIVPSLFISTTVPDAFSAATDIACKPYKKGGYCMTMLYGVLPPAMAWAIHNRESEEETDQKAISTARPALLGVGLFACAIVVEQILQDLSILHS